MEDESAAGASARAEGARRAAAREDRIRGKHRRLGGVILALSNEPQSITAWKKGAEGERKLGAGLDRLASQGVHLLHDRRRPGTRANIDHLAIAPSGVWIIDAKQYSGRVERREVGGSFKTDRRIYVAGRDRTSLVDGLDKQRTAVEKVLAPLGIEVPLHTVLCFIDADWRLFAKPFELRGTLIVWPKALFARIADAGPLDASQRQAARNRLEVSLPPAT